MAVLSYQRITLAGLNPTYAAASGGGDNVPIHPNGFIDVKNGGGSPITVTIVTPGNSRLGVVAEPDLTVSVPAAGNRLIGPFIADLTDPTDLTAKVTYSGVTSVTVAALVCG